MAAEERLLHYHILPEPAHTILAHASLGVLLHLNDKIDKDNIAHFPLAPYAARYWVSHAQFRDVAYEWGNWTSGGNRGGRGQDRRMRRSITEWLTQLTMHVLFIYVYT